MRSLDLLKLTVGIITAALVVLVGAWTQLTLRKGIEEIRESVKVEKQTTADHENEIDNLKKDVTEVKKDKAKVPKIVVVVPTVIAIPATATPETYVTPTPKRGGLLW